MSLRIRPARPEDAGVLAELAGALNRHLGEPDHFFSAVEARRDAAHYEAVIAWLDNDEGAIAAGYALFHESYETTYAARGLYLVDLHVEAAHRRRGIGRALLAHLAALARERRLDFLWWVSKPWNREAHAFYRALGAADEPLIAHALYGAAFDRLAAEAESDEPPPPDRQGA